LNSWKGIHTVITLANLTISVPSRAAKGSALDKMLARCKLTSIIKISLLSNLLSLELYYDGIQTIHPRMSKKITSMQDREITHD
jgi:hypothetical protein